MLCALVALAATSLAQDPVPAAAPRAAQTITVGRIPRTVYGDPDFDVAASASSGLPVHLDASGDCAVSGATVHVLSAGTCFLIARQPGDGRFAPAADVEVRIPIEKSAQAIQFPKPPGVTYLDPDLDLKITTTSRLPVGFTTWGPCEASGTKLHLLGAGSCTVTAHQPGDDNYLAAPIVEFDVAIARAPQTIRMAPLLDRFEGEGPLPVDARASSGRPVRLGLMGPCVFGPPGTVLAVAEGICTVTAEQPGDDDFEPARPVVERFAIRALARQDGAGR